MNARRTIAALASAAVLLAASGCGSKRSREGLVEPSSPAPAGAEAQSLRATGYLDGGSAAAAAPATGVAPHAPGGLDAVWAQQKLIRDGRIEIEVESVAAAIERIGAAAAARRALVAGSEVRRHADGRRSGTVTVKVPAAAFDDAVADLRELGEVRSETSSTQDVTKEYADLETRLAVKRRTQDRIEALLARQSGSLADLLSVERELERVVTEIERMEGEKRYYDQRVAISTIVVVLFEPGAVLRPSAFDPLREALGEALEVLAMSLAALVYVVTSAIPWVLLLWALWALVRRYRRRRRERAA